MGLGEEYGRSYYPSGVLFSPPSVDMPVLLLQYTSGPRIQAAEKESNEHQEAEHPYPSQHGYRCRAAGHSGRQKRILTSPAVSRVSETLLKPAAGPQGRELSIKTFVGLRHWFWDRNDESACVTSMAAVSGQEAYAEKPP